MSPDGNASGLQVPIVSVRRGGIRWPRRTYSVKPYRGRWAVSVQTIEDAAVVSRTDRALVFWRRSRAQAAASALNAIEARITNS